MPACASPRTGGEAVQKTDDRAVASPVITSPPQCSPNRTVRARHRAERVRVLAIRELDRLLAVDRQHVADLQIDYHACGFDLDWQGRDYAGRALARAGWMP